MEKHLEKTVLYVDDEIVNLKLFDAHFSKYFHVLTTNSAVEGLNLVEKNNVDLVIADFKMPVMNGIDFIKEIKKNHPSLKCIILSGYIESQVINEKEQHLVHEYIIKPWKKEGVLDVVEKAFS